MSQRTLCEGHCLEVWSKSNATGAHPEGYEWGAGSTHMCGMRTPLWVHLLWWVKLPCDFRGQSCGHFIGRTWTEEQGTREFFPPLSRMAHFLKPLRTKDGHFLLKEWVFGIVGWSLDAGHWEGSRRPWGLQTTFSSDPYRKGRCVCVEGQISWKGFVPHACFNQSSPTLAFICWY